jgi:hypothetical protein
VLGTQGDKCKSSVKASKKPRTARHGTARHGVHLYFHQMWKLSHEGHMFETSSGWSQSKTLFQKTSLMTHRVQIHVFTLKWAWF